MPSLLLQDKLNTTLSHNNKHTFCHLSLYFCMLLSYSGAVHPEGSRVQAEDLARRSGCGRQGSQVCFNICKNSRDNKYSNGKLINFQVQEHRAGRLAARPGAFRTVRQERSAARKGCRAAERATGMIYYTIMYMECDRVKRKSAVESSSARSQLN